MQARTMVVAVMTLWVCAFASPSPAADEKPQPNTQTKENKPDAPSKGVKAAGPRLEMGKERPKNPGKERDMRHCLDLPDAKAVIRCYEKK